MINSLEIREGVIVVRKILPRVAPNLAQYCLRTRSELTTHWANVVITQGIAQGVSNIGRSLGRVRKQYWAKIVQNFATRVRRIENRKNWPL